MRSLVLVSALVLFTADAASAQRVMLSVTPEMLESIGFPSPFLVYPVQADDDDDMEFLLYNPSRSLLAVGNTGVRLDAVVSRKPMSQFTHFDTSIGLCVTIPFWPHLPARTTVSTFNLLPGPRGRSVLQFHFWTDEHAQAGVKMLSIDTGDCAN